MPDLSETNPTWASIPEVIQTLPGLYHAVVPIKENLELLCGQRGPVQTYSVSQNIIDIKAQAGSLSAHVISLTYATIDTTNPTSLASQLTIVEAGVDDATAHGEVELRAIANPITGVSATYEWALTAGSGPSTGMRAYAKSDGTSGIGFVASQFGLTDSGTLQPVFNYSSGIFTFNAPVVIQTANIQDLAVTNLKVATAAVTNPKVQDNAVTQSAGSVTGGTSVSIAMNIRGSGGVAVFAFWDGQGGGFVSTSTTVGDLVIEIDGFTYAAVLNNFFVFVSGGLSSYSFLQTSTMAIANLSAGVHTFRAYDTCGVGTGPVRIMVMELSK